MGGKDEIYALLTITAISTLFWSCSDDLFARIPYIYLGRPTAAWIHPEVPVGSVSIGVSPYMFYPVISIAGSLVVRPYGMQALIAPL